MSSLKFGYARVSTINQSLELQSDALTKAGCDRIYHDTVSGAKEHRPGLDRMIEQLREGDTVVVWKCVLAICVPHCEQCFSAG